MAMTKDYMSNQRIKEGKPWWNGLADGGERDLEMRAEALQQEKELIDMRKKALQQEKNLAIQKRIDNLRDKIDELEVEFVNWRYLSTNHQPQTGWAWRNGETARVVTQSDPT